jgi:hypothetical protein
MGTKDTQLVIKNFYKMRVGLKCEHCWKYFDSLGREGKTDNEICLHCEDDLQVAGV